MMRTVKTSLVTALATMALLAPAGAQTAPQGTEPAAEAPAARVANGQRFGAWTVACEAIAVNETACVLSQRLVRSEGNGFLAEILAFWSGDRSTTYLAARVPNGVYLPSGFAMQAEGSDERTEFVWQSCSSDLCEALTEVTQEQIEAMSSGAEMLSGYRPDLQSEAVVFRLGLDGMLEGLAALK